MIAEHERDPTVCLCGHYCLLLSLSPKFKRHALLQLVRPPVLSDSRRICSEYGTQ